MEYCLSHISCLDILIDRLYICVYRIGTGTITACGGDGFGGGGGGRVSVDVFSRHEDPKIKVHGKSYYARARMSNTTAVWLNYD